MKFDEKNLIIDNVLSEDQIARIYYQVENSPNKKFVVEQFSQNVSDFDLPQDVYDKIVSLSEEISEVRNLEISEYQFARYKNTGEELKPTLFPHFDGFPEPRFTFDYQIGGNTTWPLVVENKEFTLGNNSALTFSGTHQIHWRVLKEFKNEEYIDMVFFHLREIDALPTEDSAKQAVLDKSEKFLQEYYGDK